MDLFLLDHRQRLPLVDLAKKANSGSRSPLFRHLSELEARKPGPLTLPSKVSKPPHAVTNTNDTEAQRLESYGLVMNHDKCLFGVLVPQHLPTGSVPCPANVDFMASEARWSSSLAWWTCTTCSCRLEASPCPLYSPPPPARVKAKRQLGTYLQTDKANPRNSTVLSN